MTLFAINLAAVANGHNEDAHSTIVDTADDAVVADAVFPKLTQF